METQHDDIFALVKGALSELNEELQYDHLEQVDDQTPIFEGDLALDSLSLVTLIVDIEGRVADAYDCEVLLASEKAMSMNNSPYGTVGSLCNFIMTEIGAAQAANVSHG